MRNTLLFLLFLGLSIGSWAQDTGSITGTVRDASGAVVPGAAVVVSNAAAKLHYGTPGVCYGRPESQKVNSGGKLTIPQIPLSGNQAFRG